MQQGVILELEDVMARAIAEVEAEGMRAVAEVQAERAEQPGSLGTGKHCSRSCREWDGFR